MQLEDKGNYWTLKPERQEDVKRLKTLGTHNVGKDASGVQLLNCIHEDLLTSGPGIAGWCVVEPALVPMPATKKEAYPWQIPGTQRVLTYRNSALFMATGTGKTSTVINAMSELARNDPEFRAIVVCPKNLFFGWKREVKIFSDNLTPFVLPEKVTLKERTADLLMASYLKGVVVITNFESFRDKKYLIESLLKTGKKWSLLVVDESHKLRNSVQYYEGLMKVKNLFTRRVILSGTPAPNDPSDVVHQLNLLNSGILGYTNKDTFKHDHAEVDSWGQVIEWKKESIEWLANRLNKFAYVLKKEDSGMNLPDKLYVTIPVEMTEEMRHHYDNFVKLEGTKVLEMTQELEALKDGSDDELEDLMTGLMGSQEIPTSVEEFINSLETEEERHKRTRQEVNKKKFALARGVLGLLTRLSQLTGGYLCGVQDTSQESWIDEKTGEVWPTLPPQALQSNPKLSALLEYVDTSITGQFVVFARYTHEINVISEELRRLGKTVEIIRGGVSGDKIQNILERWEAGAIDCLVCNAKKASHGMNLQRAGFALFYSSSYSSDDRIQAEDRIHRLGMTGTAVIVDFACDKSLDFEVIKKLKAKESLSKAVMGDMKAFLYAEAA